MPFKQSHHSFLVRAADGRRKVGIDHIETVTGNSRDELFQLLNQDGDASSSALMDIRGE
jgi:hypothetical protein